MGLTLIFVCELRQTLNKITVLNVVIPVLVILSILFYITPKNYNVLVSIYELTTNIKKLYVRITFKMNINNVFHRVLSAAIYILSVEAFNGSSRINPVSRG